MEQKAGSQRHEISETLLPVGRTGIDAGSFNVLPDQGEGLRGPYDSLLGYFIFAGFTLLLLGVVALYVLYAPVSGRLGKIGLGTAVVSVVLLAVGHPFSFMFFRSLFALGWILLGYVLWSDVREIIEDPSTPGLDEAKARRSQPPISNGDRSSSYSERRRLHR